MRIFTANCSLFELKIEFVRYLFEKCGLKKIILDNDKNNSRSLNGFTQIGRSESVFLQNKLAKQCWA